GTNTRPFPQGVAATASGDRLFVTLANLDPNFAAGGPGVVLVVDSDRGALVEHAVLVLPTGRNAGDVAWAQVGGRESMAVACAGDFEAGTGYLQNGSFHLLDVTTLREVAAIPVPSAPVEVLVVGERAFGAGAQIGDISQVDLGERTAGPIIDIPDSGVGLNYCSGLAPLDAAHLLAAEFNGDRLYVVDLARNAVTGSWTVGDGPDAVVVIPE
ncbi:MAG TPA: hypothetical protein VEI97_17220, partial [bacterium]|nr:hypothetical protein [bacterium]